MAFWERISSRGDVEDRRGIAPVAGGISLAGVVLVVAFNLLTGGDLTDMLGQISTLPTDYTQSQNAEQFAGNDEYEAFAGRVLGSNDEAWTRIFQQNNMSYQPPKLVLFRVSTTSGCGVASSEVGPHYCPEDQTIYLDETFFEELTNRFGAQGGDVAEAYVIAHEVGHHVQNQMNTIDNVSTNQDSIRLELQADCYAGIWAHSIRDQNIFEQGEIQEAMEAAAAVGDDRIQKKVTGYVNPESWTHGSSEQRMQ